jgi:hypothetical protein
LALTSPTSGGGSIGIVHLRTKATEFSLVIENGSFKYFTALRNHVTVLEILEDTDTRKSAKQFFNVIEAAALFPVYAVQEI